MAWPQAATATESREIGHRPLLCGVREECHICTLKMSVVGRRGLFNRCVGVWYSSTVYLVSVFFFVACQKTENSNEERCFFLDRPPPFASGYVVSRGYGAIYTCYILVTLDVQPVLPWVLLRCRVTALVTYIAKTLCSNKLDSSFFPSRVSRDCNHKSAAVGLV